MAVYGIVYQQQRANDMNEMDYEKAIAEAKDIGELKCC